MGEQIVRTIRVPVASARGAVIEVEIVEPPPPGRWRLWLAVKLVHWAGRLARMRVRVIHD